MVANDVEGPRRRARSRSDLLQVAERDIELADRPERAGDAPHVLAGPIEVLGARSFGKYWQHFAQPARRDASAMDRGDVTRRRRRQRLEQCQQPLLEEAGRERSTLHARIRTAIIPA